jgi:glycosyltransferase involved in cell wall biosynthesis
MAGAKVVILHALRREGGGDRRLQTWIDLFSAAGAESHTLSVLPKNRFQARISFRAVAEVGTGRAALETLVWSREEVHRHLRPMRPDFLVCMTLRTVSPRLIANLSEDGKTTTIIDLVDPLSKSYMQRSQIAGGVTGAAYRALALNPLRSESSAHRDSNAMVAAGWDDAQSLGVRWIPIIGRDDLKVRSSANIEAHRWQAIFVGSLDYPPNIDAVERLCKEIWPRVRRSIPLAVLAVAGRRPTRRLLNAVNAPGIEFVGPFDDYETLADSSALSVSPLSVSTGFQIKVLDAAQVGLPQVVTAAALKGFAPGFPARVADDDERFASAVVELLDDPRARQDLAEAARAHVHDRYTVGAWVEEIRSLIELDVGPD